MSKYKKDRSFTNYVHKALAIPKIYEPIGWQVKKIDAKKLESMDIKKGIDYILTNRKNKTISIQERFRDAYYERYTDVTLRFRREFNSDPERIESEFYKIKADYLVYGITNGKKFYDKRHTLTDFIKWAIVDLNYLRNKYKENKIEIVHDTYRKTCWVKGEILKCPENFNPDRSSSFVPFDIKLMYNLWGNQPIFAQKGFI